MVNCIECELSQSNYLNNNKIRQLILAQGRKNMLKQQKLQNPSEHIRWNDCHGEAHEAAEGSQKEATPPT